MTPFDAITRHSVYLERLKAKTIRDVLSMLDVLGEDLYIQVAKSDLENMTRKELASFGAQLNRTIKAGYIPVDAEIISVLNDFGVYEGRWQSEMLVRTGLVPTLGVASDADIWASMYSRPFDGLLLKDWISGLEQSTASRIRETISQGYVDGKSALELARDIRGTRTRTGVFNTSKRGAEGMVRTSINHTATSARIETYKKNPTIRFEQWASVLDYRTTAICQARDGTFYPVGKGPRPPAHWNCRSTMIPATNSNMKRLENRKTYQQWLKDQSPRVQDDILGVAKGKLFRDGGYTVDRFVNRAGQEMTLDQLKAADKAAWDETFGE